MNAFFKKETSHAVVIQVGCQYIVFRKNHFDDDMGSFGLILKNHEPLEVSLRNNKLSIYFESMTSHRDVLINTSDEDDALQKLNSIYSFA